MNDDHELNNRLRQVRERQNLSQSDLADQIGVTRQTILAIEKGRLNPSITICLKLARALQEPLDYIFYLDRPSDRVQELAQMKAPAAKSSARPKRAPTQPPADIQPSKENAPAENQKDEQRPNQSIWEFMG